MAGVVYWLFFLSGFAALAYELSWSRQIGLLFGHTAGAAAVVLSAYFGGMALGSFAAGSRWLRLRSPLRGYAVAELMIALWAVLTPEILQLLQGPAVAGLLNHDDPSMQAGARAIAAFTVLMGATVPMGATLPFIAQHMSPTTAQRPYTVAFAYAVNTAGALAGALLTTYVLIMWLGVAGSSYLAAALSAVCGVLALVLSRRSYTQGGQLEPEGRIKPVTAWPPKSSLPLATLYGLAITSGFGTLGLQVLYTRLFALIQNNSTYSFGTVVFAFLAALAAAGWTAGRTRGRPELIGWAMLLGALAIPATVLLLWWITDLDYLRARGGFAGYMTLITGLIFLTVCPVVYLLGLILPTVWRVSTGRTAQVVGRLTGANMLAATAGALLTAFLILPTLGLWWSLVAFSLLYLVVGTLLLLRRQARYKLAVLAVAAISAYACFELLHVPGILQARVEATGNEFVYQRDTPYGQIDVLRRNSTGALRLRQNRFYTLGTTGSLQFELQQGLVPLRLHPDPRKVAFIGLGTGVTAGAALHSPGLEELTVIELIPEVVEAARFFEAHNFAVLSDSRTRIVINDARHFLYATEARFDLIVSDLFVPWHSQTGYLYTVEHYRTAAARLAPGGLFFQWLPAYQLSAADLEMIADSFASVFPVTTVWIEDSIHGYPLVGLAGTADPLRLRISSTLPALEQQSADHEAAAVQVAQLQEVGLWEHYVGDWRVLAGALLNTDEYPRIEFLAPIGYAEELRLKGPAWRKFKSEVLGQLPRQNVEVSSDW